MLIPITRILEQAQSQGGQMRPYRSPYRITTQRFVLRLIPLQFIIIKINRSSNNDVPHISPYPNNILGSHLTSLIRRT